MASRQSGIRPPNVIPSKIPPPSLAGVIPTALPRPSGLPTMKPNTNSFVPHESPVHNRQPGTPQSGCSSYKDMDSWDSESRRYSDAGIAGSRRDSEVLTEDTDSFIIGDVVWVGGAKRGKIAYIGETQFAKGEWAGVALDAPVGKHDGMVQGIRYFQCDPMHGTFARLHRLTRKPLPPYDSDDCFVHGNTPPRCLADFRRSPSPFRSKSPSPGPLTPTRLGSPGPAIKVGDRVIVQSSSGTKRGLLRFIGTTMFAPGEWAGIELDQPIGKNDGSVGSHRYFTCPDKYGLFAPVFKVSSSPANRLTTSTSLRKHGSRESMLSNMSSAASSSAPRAFRSVLQEKEKHLEQLLKERDLDMAEVAQANRNYEDRIEDLMSIQQMLAQKQEEYKQQAASYAEKISQLEEENKSLKISLEEERKEHEDLLFTYEEEKINQADLQATLCNSENGSDDALALRTLVQQYTDKLKQRETEVVSLKEKLSKQQSQLDEALSENNENQLTIKKLQSEIDSNHKKIRSMEEYLAAEIVHSQHAIATVERAHAHKLQEVTNFTQKVEELSSTLVNTMKQYEDLKAEKLALEDELNQTILAKTVEPGALESRLRLKEQETAKLQDHIKELQQLNSSLTSIWEYNVKNIEDNFKTKELSLEERIKELEVQLQRQAETTEKTIQNLQLQLGLKTNQ